MKTEERRKMQKEVEECENTKLYYTAPLSASRGLKRKRVQRLDTMEKEGISFFYSLSQYALSPGKALLLQSFLKAPWGRK